ncbi:MAG: alginate biosynthesis protein AlgK, partial [Pseudomonas sp.]
MTTPTLNTPPTLWERACSRWDRRGLSDAPSQPHREQARSHMGFAFCSLALAISLTGCAGLPDQR